MAEPARLLEVPEVAALLHVSEWSVNKLIQTGELPSLLLSPTGKSRGRRLIRPDAVDAYTKRLEQEATADREAQEARVVRLMGRRRARA